jgi:peroxiredoxin
MQYAGMNAQRLAVTGLLAVIVGSAGFAIGARGSRAMVRRVDIGSPAPDFPASTLERPPRRKGIVAYRGQVVLLNLWATWCVPCEVEMPSIERLHQALGPRGLKVVAVSIDDPGNENRIRDFVARHALTFEILNEGTGAIEAAYLSPGIPTTFLIDRQGVIRKKVIGAADWNTPERRQEIEELLRTASN